MNLKLFLESLLEILFPQRLHWLCSQVYLYWKKFSTTIPFILTKLPIYNMINSKSLFKWLTFSWLDINYSISNILISELVVITQFFDVFTVNIIQKPKFSWRRWNWRRQKFECHYGSDSLLPFITQY